MRGSGRDGAEIEARTESIWPAKHAKHAKKSRRNLKWLKAPAFCRFSPVIGFIRRATMATLSLACDAAQFASSRGPKAARD